MSPSERFDEFIRKFVEAGNKVVGRPSKIFGNCSILEYKTGSQIVFDKNCTIRDSTFQFPLGGGFIHIGENVQYNARTHISSLSKINIGHGTVLNRNCEIHAWENANITVGENCLFSNIKIRTSDMHSIFDKNSRIRINDARSVDIEDRVWLGEGTIVSKGARIGHGSIIGALSLVTGYIPPNCVAAGVPARVVRRNVNWKRKLEQPNPRPSTPPHEMIETRNAFFAKWRRLATILGRGSGVS